MSREIKFRAWDEIGEWMGDVTSIDFDERTIFMTTRCIDDENCFELDKTPVMQYTGLKDKNGKEIFEGDIITGKGIQGVIKWIPEHCGFLIHEEMGYTFIDAGNAPATSYEVIGNIYEHPELLEATS
ncbi:hypothetical protein C3943_18050 [Lysinibacillus sp. B2A1]|nr:hypothetical protein C3943_18050 [Lysinibacillus sp. B2A1]